MPRKILNRPMFSRGGYKLPAYGSGGFKPKVKWKLDDVVEEYGIKGLEWLQRKIYGGSWVPESWSQKLLNKRKKDLETEYGSGAGEGIFSDVETRAEIDPSKLDTEHYTRNNLVDALKWCNEGWANPFGYVPKVWPVPLRPLRKEETMTGWGKEILGKGAKALTTAGVISGGKELLKSDEIKAQEKIIEELDNKNIDLGWAEDQSLPIKTIENEILENPLGEGNAALSEALGMDTETITGTGSLLDDLPVDNLEQQAATEIKTAVTDGNENVTDFNKPITEAEAESGNVVDLKSIRKDYEKNKEKKTDQTEIDDNIESVDAEAIRKNNEALSQGMMELEPSDLTEIQQYIGFLQSIMGKRDPMMSASLLLQLGTSLMNAKTSKQGIDGFIEAAGQAGMQIAPQLMKLGAMNEERKQALATAALQLYMDKVKQSRPSGAPYTVAEIDWQQNDAGSWYANGVKSVKQMQLNSDPFRSAMAEDDAFFQQFNRPKYSFISPASGQDVPVIQGALGRDTGALITDTGKKDFQQTAGYMNDILDVSIPFLTQLMDNEHLMGASGELAEKGFGVKSTFEDVLSLLKGESPEWEDNMAKSFFSLGDSFEKTGLTGRDANDAIDIGGQSIPVFIDWENKLGMNKDGMTSPSHDRRLLGLDAAGNPIGIRSFMVKDGVDKFFNADVIGSMDLIARTVGTGYARSRQPTGRMLADVLQGSLKDAKYTGLGTNQKSSRWAVLSAHTSIISEMYEKIETAYRNAGITNNPEVVNPNNSLQYVAGMRYVKTLDGGEIGNTGKHLWNVKGFKEFANKYYTLKESVNSDLKDIPFYTFNEWQNDTNIQLQNTIIKKNKEESNVKDSIIDTFDKGFDFIMGNQ